MTLTKDQITEAVYQRLDFTRDESSEILDNLLEIINREFEKEWVVYLLRCSDGSLYCGITNNIKNRLAAHNSDKGSKYTRSRNPVELIGTSTRMTKSNALKLEYRVKKTRTNQKLYELTKKGENLMASDLEKSLKTVKKDLEKLLKDFNKIADAVVKEVKPAKKAAPKKKVAAKKAPTKKKTTTKKPAAKKKAAPKKKVAAKKKPVAKKKA